MNKTNEQSALRKHFAVPEFHIIELSSDDIICTSTGSFTGPSDIGKGEDSDWSDADLDW